MENHSTKPCCTNYLNNSSKLGNFFGSSASNHRVGTYLDHGCFRWFGRFVQEENRILYGGSSRADGPDHVLPSSSETSIQCAPRVFKGSGPLLMSLRCERVGHWSISCRCQEPRPIRREHQSWCIHGRHAALVT